MVEKIGIPNYEMILRIIRNRIMMNKTQNSSKEYTNNERLV